MDGALGNLAVQAAIPEFIFVSLGWIELPGPGRFIQAGTKQVSFNNIIKSNIR